MIPARTISRPAGLLAAFGDTHPGLQRDHNEDRFHCDPLRGIFFVVDGVGGQAAGEKAAEIAVGVLRERLERETGTVEDRIREAIALANNNIHRMAAWNPEWRGMGCVLTVAVVSNGSAVVGHVGDTRLYKMRAGRLEKITRDHSPVGEREDANELTEAEAMRHPRRNEVYRDVGSEPHQPGDPDFIDLFRIGFEPDAALLLCSDGLSDSVSSAAIAQIVRARAGRPYEVVRALIDAANDAGGKDNVTVVYVEGDEFGGVEAAPGGAAAAARDRVDHTAASARPASRARRRRIALVVLLALVAIASAVILLRDRWPRTPLGTSLPVTLIAPSPTSTDIVVSPGESISAAVARAGPGTTVIVEPGEYREQVHLRSGVRVRSRVPRAAAIRLRGEASESDPAVVAIDVSGAEFSGFRIVGDAATPLGAGIYVRSAQVTLSDFEVTGAAVAAIELAAGADASLAAGDIHDNPGAGLVIRSGASPRIVHSRFARNGRSGRSAAAIVIEAGARPHLSGNVFHGVTPDILTGLSQSERKAVAEANWFLRR